MSKPIMLLDVDGPLNPFAAKATRRPEGFETHRTRPTGWEVGKPLRVWLNPAHGAKLKACGYEIIWCSAWQDEANEWIGPPIGLPELEAIQWGPHEVYTDKDLHWKTRQIVSFMAENYPDRPFIWIDDEATEHDEKHLKKELDQSLKIFVISPKEGLQDEDFEEIKEWCKKNAG